MGVALGPSFVKVVDNLGLAQKIQMSEPPLTLRHLQAFERPDLVGMKQEILHGLEYIYFTLYFYFINTF